MRICANIMVKNEEARIERCLNSLIPYVNSFVICDTGSEDKTKQIIKNVLDLSKSKYHLVDTTFKTWDQARNNALGVAKKLEPDSDYIMLVDADMSLVVDSGFSFDSLTCDSYQVKQENDFVSYLNIRLIKTKANAAYHGVTHEFITVEGTTGVLENIRFIDYADGANRVGKFQRDIDFLRGGMDNGLCLRYMFYLAQSYRDNGQLEEAMKWYLARAEAGGWWEEAWFSIYMAGMCAKNLGKIPEFLDLMFKASVINAKRAEPWMALSNYFKDKGWHELCFMFAERASKCKEEMGLFVNKENHSYAPLIDMSISGYYAGDDYREIARRTEYRLLTENNLPVHIKNMVMKNAKYHLRNLSSVCPGTMIRLENIGVSDGCFGECNPSVANHPMGGLEMIVRSTNYKYDSSMDGVILDGSNVIKTRNFYLRLDGSANILSIKPINIDGLGEPPFVSKVTGFENLRLFRFENRLFSMATSRQYNPQDKYKQVLLELSEDGVAKRVIPINYGLLDIHEKNWMPIVGDKEMMMIYSLFPFTIIRINMETGDVDDVKKDKYALSLETWHGGSQAIPYDDGWVFIIHESACYPDSLRVYWHRFVKMDKFMNLTHYTEPFYFTKIGIEFCAGLCHFNGGLLTSFGVDDRQAGLCFTPYGALNKAWLSIG